MNKYVQATLTGGAGVLALGAYVYVLGGALMWLRLNAAGLPSDAVTTSFLDRQLLATGLKALIFEAFLIPILAVTVWVAWKFARRINRQLKKLGEDEEAKAGASAEVPVKEQPADNEEVLLIVLRAAVATIFVNLTVFDFFELSEAGTLILSLAILAGSVVIGALILFRDAPKWISKYRARPQVRKGFRIARWLLTAAVAGIAIFAAAAPLGLTLLVLLALAQFSERLAHLPQIEDMRQLTLTILTLAGALSLVILSYLATPPVSFDRLEIQTKDGEKIEGAYVGRSSDGVYLGVCTAKDSTTSVAPRIHIVRTDRIDDVFVDSGKYSFDYGDRPSIFGFIVDFAQRDTVPNGTAPLQLDFRDDKPVCGLSSVTRAPG